MKDRIGWDDLALFAAVARNRSLTRAAEVTGASAPTLSRRMKALEARIGRRLFVHGAEGYTPTGEGRALMDRAARMEEAAAEIEHWRTASGGPVRVRLSAGTWTARRLARDLRHYWSPDAPWVPEFVQCNLDMDIARREIDIGVRNRRPEQPWLAGRRTGAVAYAVYATAPEVTGWIGASVETHPLPSEAWMQAHHADAFVTLANSAALRLELAQAGLGRTVLPTFAGDAEPGLVRVSDPIAELASEEWLVSHHEARHDPPIRAALDALGAYLSGGRG
ncbi:LysR family transcriptional regulator [Roseobacter sp. HKCCA0434]|uniref:LysR family transcriptional regulator n=1 Tax=Roseobacter sp. HKCCA0434 TaxID=3079297 RepID=UPI002905CECC|nr:LysR family transcriptional regulator [Roseobacter sp. HKCCA0434]